MMPNDFKNSGNSQNRSYFYQEPCFKLFENKRFVMTADLVNGSYKENLGMF